MSGQDEFIATIVVFMVFIALCVCVSSSMDSIRCNQAGKILNYKTEWHYWTGCVVETSDGEKVLLRQLRNWNGVIK